MTIIQNEYLRGSVVFDTDFRKGSIADRSPYKAAATVTAPVIWANTKLGYGVRMTGTGLISYADNAANRLAGSSATWIILGKFDTVPAVARILSKRNAAKIDWDVITGTTSVSLFDGTNLSSTTVSIVGKKLIALTLVSGAKPNVYLDGTFAAEGSLTCTIPTNVTPPELYVSNYYNGTFPFKNILNRIIILNRALPAQEVAQLYQELMSERYPLRAYSFGSRISAPQDPPGCPALLKTDFTTKLPDGRLADLSGNGWHGTVKPGFAAGPGMYGNALMAGVSSRTYVDFGDVTPINGASKLTVLWYGTLDRSEYSWIFDKGAANATRFDMYYSSVNAVFYMNLVALVKANATYNAPFLSTLVFDGSLPNTQKTSIIIDNGAPQKGEGTGMESTLPNNVGTSLQVGRFGWFNGGTVYPPAKQNDLFVIYPSALTPEQVQYVYRQIARRSTFQLDLNKVPVSLANLVGPLEVPNTPFRVQSGGTWKISEDGYGKHWFESVAGNNTSIYTSSTQAYGSFVFNVYHTTASEYIFVISNKISITDANRAAYGVYLSGTTLRFIRFFPGSLADRIIFNNAVELNTSYTFCVTRNSSGEFTLYIKGGIYKQWTKPVASSGTNPIVDATYTTSAYSLFSTDTATGAAKFAQPRMFQGVLTIDQLQTLCP